MTPRTWADRNTLRARIDAFKKQRMMTHWSHQVKLFPELANMKGPEFDVELSDIGKRLVGIPDYYGKEEDFHDMEESGEANSSSANHPKI